MGRALAITVAVFLLSAPASAEPPATPESAALEPATPEEEDESEPDPKAAESALVATEPLPPPPPPPRIEPKSYAGQTLLVDLLAFGTLIGGAVAQSEEAVWFSLATYALGPPIVHLAHRNYGTSLGSLGMRVFGPIAGAYLGCAVGGGNRDCVTGAVAGVIGAYLAVVMIDAGALAWDDQPPEKPTARVLPYTAWSTHGGVFGLQGLF